MEATTFETPVALFVFKRPDTTRRVFDAISKVRPGTLLLIADGPRQHVQGEIEGCRQVREIVARIDWPCEVYQNFSDTNLGCQERIISGLNWTFSLVAEAIVLEDDCLPDVSFFPFCRELLERYRGDSRVCAISGTNLVEKHLKIEDSYYFSRLGGNWGWATWRSEWQRYDRHLSGWVQLKREGMLSELFDDPKVVAYWTRVFDDMYQNNGRNAWDYQWVYTHLKNNALTIIPRVNLVANIGFGPGATHTAGPDTRLTPRVSTMLFPLRHPQCFVPLRSADRRFHDLVESPLSQRILRILCRISNRLR
jgi:hypothetical protein